MDERWGRIEGWDFGAATFLSPPLGLVVGAASVGMPETMDAGLAPCRLAGRDCARRFVASGELAELTVRACAAPPWSGAQAIACAADPSPGGATRGRQVGGTYPRRLAGCGAGRRQAPRRRTDGCTCRRAHHGAAVSFAITHVSSTTSTSSRESLSKARHMATSSQESRGPCSAPVASSTMV